MRKPITVVALALVMVVQACENVMFPQYREFQSCAGPCTYQDPWNNGEKLNVTTITTGEDLDPDGYVVRVRTLDDNGVEVRSRGFNHGINFTYRYTVGHGTKEVSLENVALNCTVQSEMPLQFYIPATPLPEPQEVIPTAEFEVVCEALP